MNGKRLQVLFISSWYPNRLRPLLGIFIKRHAIALAKLCDVSSIYVYADENESIEEAIEENVFTIRLGYKRVKTDIPILSGFLKLRAYFNAWKKATEIYKQKKGIPDIVNLNVIIPAGNVASYLKHMWHVPYVISEHWTGYFPEDGRYKGLWMKSMAQKVVKNASAVITVSTDLKNQMLKAGLNNDYHVISNIVDTNVFNVPAIKVKGEKVRFIHVSALDDTQKNILGMIRVFKKVHDSFPNVELIIIGNGSEKSKLEELANSLGLKDSVHFGGQKIEQELVALLQSSDAFVLFSNYETQAIVLLEALCCGTPVIATKAGGISDYVNSRNGILVEPKNEEQLYNAMVSIVNERSGFGSPESIRATVVDKVNADSIAKQYVEVYNKVLNR